MTGPQQPCAISEAYVARESDSISLDNQMARIDRIENEDRRPTTDMGLSGSNQEMDNSIT